MAYQSVIDEIKDIIKSLSYGSVEVIVQDGQVTQISTRIIKKTQVAKPKISKINTKKESQSGINANFKY